MTERLTSQKKVIMGTPPKRDPLQLWAIFATPSASFPLFPPAATEAGRRRRGTHEIIIRGAKKATEVAKKYVNPR